MTNDELKDFLDRKSDQYNHPRFIESDPIQVPHRFSTKEDIEIAGFLAATIAWGNRKATIASATRMMTLMGDSPYDFTMSANDQDFAKLDGFVHRTFNARDLKTMLRGFRNIYTDPGGMEKVFRDNIVDEKLHHGIHQLRKKILETGYEQRFVKHIADPLAGSAAKRIHLFLRWMIRDDKRGVDFGIWKTISPSVLSCPLDVHSGRTARKLGLISRKADDSKSLLELDTNLRKMDPSDPAKYDFALFGLGLEKF